MDGADSASRAVRSKKPAGFGSEELLDEFVIKLKRGEIGSGLHAATSTVELIRTLISRKKLTTIDDLIDYVHHVGKLLTDAKPVELIIGNIVRRILKIIREAGKEIMQELNDGEQPLTVQRSPSPVNDTAMTVLKRSYTMANVDNSLSLHKLLDQPASISEGDSVSGAAMSLSLSSLSLAAPAPVSPLTIIPPTSFHQQPQSSRRSKPSNEDDKLQRELLSMRLKPAVIEDLGLLMDEVKDSESEIAKQSVQHIYAREVIMTYGCSETVTAFLKEAAEFRRFEVIVIESAPTYDGHRQAKLLSSPPYPIEVTLISDSAVFAMMPSVNKVIVGCHAVMANGGLIVNSGGLTLSVAARHHSVPFVVLTGLHKLTPLYPFNQSTFNEYRNPHQLLPFHSVTSKNLTIENPAYDYITPDLVTLLLTNFGGHNPNYVYRLLADHYHPLDTHFRGKAVDANIVSVSEARNLSRQNSIDKSQSQHQQGQGEKKGKGNKRQSVSTRTGGGGGAFDD